MSVQFEVKSRAKEKLALRGRILLWELHVHIRHCVLKTVRLDVRSRILFASCVGGLAVLISAIEFSSLIEEEMRRLESRAGPCVVTWDWLPRESRIDGRKLGMRQISVPCEVQKLGEP